MADSLVLTGVKDVKKHTGTEMLLTRPRRGGDTHSIKEWWKGGVSTCYAECTIFDVTVGPDTVKLVLDTNMSTNVRISHDGAFGFTFSGANEIRRGALFTSDFQLIEHYVFPAISAGKVMTVTPPGAADKPSGVVPPVIGSITLSGDTDVAEGDHTYTVTTPFATATQLAYAWSVTGGTIASGDGTDSIVATLAAGSAQINVSVSATDAGVTDSPQTAGLPVTVS